MRRPERDPEGAAWIRENDPVLACRDLHRYLGAGEVRVHAVRGVSMELDPGRAYAIQGPSGCGKSTLLYSLGLLDRPDAGTVALGGRTLSDAGDDERTRARAESLGFVFQFHFLLPEFSAEENLILPMRRKGGLSFEAMRARAAYLLDRVGLADKANRPAGRLSGGEQQRVAVARALANSPLVVLADEPTGNLDAANAERVADLLIELARERNHAVVMVTHNPAIAAKCDARIAMLDGRLNSDWT